MDLSTPYIRATRKERKDQKKEKGAWGKGNQDFKICKWELRFKMFYKRLLSDWKNECVILESLHFAALERAEA